VGVRFFPPALVVTELEKLVPLKAGLFWVLLKRTFLSRQVEYWAKIKLCDSVLQLPAISLPWHEAEVTQGNDHFLQSKSKKCF